MKRCFLMIMALSMTLASCGLRHKMKETLANYDENHEMRMEKVEPCKAVYEGDRWVGLDSEDMYHLMIFDAISVVVADSIEKPTLVVDDESDLSRVTITNDQGTIYVRYRGRRLSDRRKIVLYLPPTIPLCAVHVYDASSFVAGTKSLDYVMDVVADDASYVKVEGDTLGGKNFYQFRVQASDAAKVVLRGATAARLILELEDAANVDARGMTATQLEVDMEDAAAAQVNVKQGIEGRMSDICELKYMGSPEIKVKKEENCAIKSL